MAEKANSFLDQLKENTKSDDTVERLNKEVADFYEIAGKAWAKACIECIKESAMAKAKAGEFEEIDGKKVINGTYRAWLSLPQKENNLLTTLNAKLIEAKLEEMLPIKISKKILSSKGSHKFFLIFPYKRIEEKSFSFTPTPLCSAASKALKQAAEAEGITMTSLALPYDWTRRNDNLYIDYAESPELFINPFLTTHISEENVFTGVTKTHCTHGRLWNTSETIGYGKIVTRALIFFSVKY